MPDFSSPAKHSLGGFAPIIRFVRVVGGAMLITLFQCLRGNVNLSQ
ncbi:MAG TPA: hypothetical protein RMI62_17820 [Polyangiaceae bacterium LLY-WYZ-15_(1-7)]|nr:hypothetical protein [Polyangiaceae bacterium LLY-WYZ-15_(1-7)]